MLASDLDFVQIDDSPMDHTLVTIETTGQTEGFYTLTLYSKSYHDPTITTLWSVYPSVDAGVTVIRDDILRVDVITIEIPSYYHVVPLVEMVTVRKDETLTVIIPNCVPTITISPIQNVDLR